MARCECKGCSVRRAARKPISVPYGIIRKIIQETPFDGCLLVFNVPNVASFKRQANLYGVSYQMLSYRDFIIWDRAPKRGKRKITLYEGNNANKSRPNAVQDQARE